MTGVLGMSTVPDILAIPFSLLEAEFLLYAYLCLQAVQRSPAEDGVAGLQKATDISGRGRGWIIAPCLFQAISGLWIWKSIWKHPKRPSPGDWHQTYAIYMPISGLWTPWPGR
ncbi:unnamed protein product [Cladocopium goreaui]|uniref:Uncharacterized protein n=1 Tax=Cladocopium goreaui TaxID=2562237 RepID=A0A9P1D6H1_9DINO|nr:unnamed protein product [Cladocopium goreaui]|mmetsp:Transcript_38206/g.82391  ORF Transcript_38206/g.82391 Transcript_38206/m.82391 type:complete len:113 (-) Transcript_38206:233-571(-)